MDRIVVLDFGGQYSHLIAKRIREVGVYSELLPYNTPADGLGEDVKGIVLSGGPSSVYQKDAPMPDPRIFELGLPILGICYGLQLIAFKLGGRVSKGRKREYGRAELIVKDFSDLFSGLPGRFYCWMSHVDKVTKLPKGFEAIAYTKNSRYAAVRDKVRKIYGVQFHPEVTHTEHGRDIIENFAVRICGCRREWNAGSFIERAVKEIREKVGEDRVLCALSGGVDSTTTAVLVKRAIGDRLFGIFVNHGLMREGEPEEVIEMLKGLGINFRYVDASERFLRRLKGVSDPEEKRRIVGEEFVKVFEEEAKKLGRFKYLAQGTLYPDVIESARSGSFASRIKSHHNVAGLPESLGFELIEPLRELYKDEVREVARELGLPEWFVRRHPFPGPGLAVRIIGEVNEEKLRIVRKASSIVEEELKKAGLYDEVWQAFAFVGEDRAVGVQGDERRYGRIVTIRIVCSEDGMTADWFRIPYEVLERMSNRITNEVEGVTMVTYSVSSKPPSTIEPQ
ncbi:MAG: glutamine-hydrolyzing GMP synthase [Thaumarchaeota archaeon]|nr:glutamine-hydrolyzing GMP synthase [Nitrososphaerota archaeon]